MLNHAGPQGVAESLGLLNEGRGDTQEMNELPSHASRPQQIRRPSSIRTGSGSGSNSRSGSMRASRTPRTPNMKVRFDLPERASKSLDGGQHQNIDPHRNGQVNGSAVRSSAPGSMWDADEHLTDDTERNEVRNYTRESIDDNMDNDGHGDDHFSAPLLPSATGAITSSLELDNPLDRKTSSLQAAISNMSNSILGAGIIGQPYALKSAGLITGVTLLIVLTVVVDWTIRLIVINSKMSGRNTFQGTVEFCYGKWGLLAISAAQWAFAFGGMVAFAVIVGDSIPPVFHALWPGMTEVPVIGWLATRTGAIIFFCGSVSWPLSLYRDISKLAKASTLALISMLVIIITVVSQSFSVAKELRGDFPLELWTINSGVFQAIGVISFGTSSCFNSSIITS